MLAALASLSARAIIPAAGEHHFFAVWRTLSHSPPSWVAEILDRELAWGYVFYKTTQVDERVGDDWDEAQERLEDLDTVFFEDRPGERPIWETAGPASVHSRAATLCSTGARSGPMKPFPTTTT